MSYLQTLLRSCMEIQVIEQQLVLCPGLFPLLVPPDQPYLTQSLFSAFLNQPVSHEYYAFLCCHFCS